MLQSTTDTITIFTCEDNFESMMTCIYDAWSARLGHSKVRLMTEPIGNYELFCTYRHIDADQEKVQKVISSIHRKISSYAYGMVFQAAMSCQPDKLDTIYRFLVAGFHYGASVIHYLQEPVIMRMMEITRNVSNEAHFHRELIRFSDLESNALISYITPKNNILTMVAPHFADRMPSENWMIVDSNRRTAIIHPKDEDYYLTSLSEKEMDQLSHRITDPYSDLWKEFFHSISIQARYNPRCQRNMLPLWYRKNMTEFRS